MFGKCGSCLNMMVDILFIPKEYQINIGGD